MVIMNNMKSLLRKQLDKHITLWTKKEIIYHTIIGIFFLTTGILLTYFANIYTKGYTGGVVSDILLDNLPVMNVGVVFFQGSFIFLLCLVAALLFEPKYIPFTLESTGLFFLVRSIFTMMTHLSAPSVEYYNYIIKYGHDAHSVMFTLSSGNDLFFSGHAGYPFLLALIFWRLKYFRYFFLLCSIVGSIAVILGHLHYTIDVFSAFFIAFGIIEIAKRLFREFVEGLD